VRRYELESRTKISSVDILVAVGETKVVVEVDGPSHYAANRCDGKKNITFAFETIYIYVKGERD
jgi:very-short-patch-repair endonuclease